MKAFKFNLFAVFFIFLPTYAFADVSGIMMIIKGDVQVVTKGKAEKAKAGRKVLEGDIIKTAVDGRAKIVMSDKNILNISPSSSVEISTYKNDPSTNSRKVELKVDYGKVRASVEQKYDSEKNTFLIKTPTAVAGVRGTEFTVSFNQNLRKTEIITFNGLVAFGNIDKSGKPTNIVMVRPGERSESSASQPPALPIKVDSQELEKQNQDSQIDYSKNNSEKKQEETKSAINEKENKNDNKEGDKTDGKANGDRKNDTESNVKSDSNQKDDKKNNEKADNKKVNEPKNNEMNNPIAADENKSGEKNKEAKNEPPREPASAINPNNESSGPKNPPPPPPMGDASRAPSMINSSDMAPQVPSIIELPKMPTMPSTSSNLPNPSLTQDIVKEVIQNNITGGPSKVIIRPSK